MLINKFLLIFIFFIISNNALSNNAVGFKINGKVFISNYISKISESISYTGHIKEKLIEKEANPEELFVFVPISYKADKKDLEIFDPDRIYLEINKVRYKRKRNVDIFEDLEIKSFPFIQINFGKHEGLLFYRIPVQEKINIIKIVYDDIAIEVSDYVTKFNY